MTSRHLISTVIVLRPEKSFSSAGQYMGRAAQKIALGLISQVNSALADELHHTDGILSFTVSDLFQSSRDYHWMRITALRDDVITALQSISSDATFDGWYVQQIIDTQHDWTCITTLHDLINTNWQPTRHLKLQFKTATAIKSKGLYRPLPYAELVFKSLFERWQTLTDISLPYTPETEVLDLYLTYAISIRDYDITSHQIMMKHAPIQGFSGKVNFYTEAPSRALKRLANRSDERAVEVLKRYDDLTCLLNLLSEFGFYSGVGIKTAQGMGMMRRL